MFDPQAQDLAEHCRLLAFDLRARKGATEPYHLYDLALDCRQVLDELGLSSAVWGGVSMGAFAALRGALRFPERVNGLVLMSCQATALPDADRREWSAHYASQRGGRVSPEFAEGEAEVTFAEITRKETPELVAAWVERFSVIDGDVLHAEAISWLEQDDVLDQLTAIAVPTLVIHGADDAAVPVSEAHAIAERVPGAELLVVPNAGHAVNLEQPAIVNEAIARFMRSL